ncbi:MAG: hypothetical protein ACD_42C00218G0002 [uncultured bacterium]|nr:MAG: hypothetical protein ACD_42C00218G0002 [uncultured bacterium]
MENLSKLSNQKNYRLLPWIIFGTGILYYCFAYLLRVYPSVMENHLLDYFHVSVGDFGWITGFYYIAYAPMQLPVGVTVDRIGARRSLLLGCIIALIGVFIFANTHQFGVALAGRFLIGLGAAFGYVTALKIASLWLPRKYFATATGFLTGAGMLAAIATDNYLTHLIRITPFHDVLLFPAYIGVTLFVLILLFVRNKKPEANDNLSRTSSYRELCRQLWGIMKMPQMWLIGLVGALLYLPSSVFIDAWAIPFLKTARHFSRTDAAFGASLTLAGWIISSFTAGYLSDRFETRRIPLLIATLGAAVVSACILFLPVMNHDVMYGLLFMLGIFCGPHPLCFSLSKENCPHEISATAVSFANFVIMIGGMIMQPAVGGFLGLLSNTTTKTVNAVYSNWDFSIALSIIPIGLIIAYFVTLFIKETFGKQN